MQRLEVSGTVDPYMGCYTHTHTRVCVYVCVCVYIYIYIYICTYTHTYLCGYFDVLLTMHLSIFISVINQLDTPNFCFTISLVYASTCFKHVCSSSGGQNCVTQPLVSSHL